MNLTFKLLVCLVIIAWISCVAYGRSVPDKYQSGDGEVEFVTGSPGTEGEPGYGGPGYGGPRNVFKDWMKFVQGFFKDGNWENGGPANFGRFIGNQVSKLIEMLTRDDNWFSKR